MDERTVTGLPGTMFEGVDLRIVSVPSIFAGCEAFGRVKVRAAELEAAVEGMVTPEVIERLRRAEDDAFRKLVGG